MKAVTYALVGLIAAVQAGLWLPGGGVPQVVSLQGQLDQVRSQNEAARVRNEQLAAEVNDLRTGQEIIEEMARFELGMVKQDEVYIQIAPRR